MKIIAGESLVNGRPTRIDRIDYEGRWYSISPRFPRCVALEDEWFDDVPDPHAVIAALRAARLSVDIFTFWQRLPDTLPHFDYPLSWESVASLPVTTFDHWWNRQIKAATRNLVRKSEKKGVEVRLAHYDDAFVHGVTDIFNETPVRQGRPFWHYGKSVETVKQQFSRFLFREDLIGAYYDGELIGFAMVGNAGRYAVLGQIISKLEHRDKSPNNALIAKAVEVCADRKLPYLVYASWTDGSLADFKRHNGFAESRLPRYHVPLSLRGQASMALGLHHGWKSIIPSGIKDRLKTARASWLSRRAHHPRPSPEPPGRDGD